MVIEEKIEHKIRKTLYAIVKYHQKGLMRYSFNFNTTLKRFAAEDVYSIYNRYNGNTIHESWEHGKYGHQVINVVNNKIKLQKHFVLGERDYKLSSGDILFHHSEVSQKFRDTSYLYSYLKGRDIYEGIDGNWRFTRGKSLFRKIVSVASFFDFPRLKKNYKISSSDIVEMKFIKQLGIRTIQTPYIIHYKSSPLKSANLKINTLQKVSNVYLHTQFSKFYIKFKKLSWINHNSHIATIYWKPNDKVDVFNSDFKLQKGSHIKINNNKYEIVFEKNENLKADQQSMQTNGTIEVGKILIPSFTSYDFEKKKTTNDFNEFSERGIFIPYDFQGEFFYQLQFGINKVFKDMIFFVKQNVVQKALDPYAGKIKVQITTNSETEQNKNTKAVVISSKNFKEIIDLGEIINPLAILRFAHEDEEES